MKPEEILDKIIPDSSDNFDANYRDEVLNAMSEWASIVAKQECIDFANYLNKYYDAWEDAWVFRNEANKGTFPTHIVFEFYLQSKQK